MHRGKRTILGIVGSLRQGSYNRLALRAMAEMATSRARFVFADLTQIPLYNEDLMVSDLPQAVHTFRRQIEEAHAVVIATAEYNYSIPGVLKNALDWASLPPLPPFENKPVALLSATTGNLGGPLAQHHLRQILTCLKSRTIVKPEVYIPRAQECFTPSGSLTDLKTRQWLEALLEALLQGC